MKIGIIGARRIGSTLTRCFRAVGHEVVVANSRGPDSLTALAGETGARAGSVDDVVRSAELVVPTISLRNVESLPDHLFANAPSGVIVIDTCNYYPRARDRRIDGIEAGGTESGWVQERIGHRVVKAFNSIYAQSLFENGGPPARRGGSRSRSWATKLATRRSS